MMPYNFIGVISATIFFLDPMVTCSDNQITEISGISSLRQLTHLSLADNRLEHITNLDNLPIKTLNLVSCSTILLLPLGYNFLCDSTWDPLLPWLIDL